MERILHDIDLTKDKAYLLFKHLAKMSYSQQSSILSMLQQKKESIDEIMGGYAYFSQFRKNIAHDFDVVDIVGTGGDGNKTFNISTLASIVVASCGVLVAKHGGKSASSVNGSFDTVNALGMKSAVNDKNVIAQLKENSYVYLWAPIFNDALKHYGPLRKKMASPTIFNILGPLLNPTLPKRSLIGVYRDDLRKKMAKVLIEQGITRALIVFAVDGLDEISISAATKVLEINHDEMIEYQITPEQVGLKRAHKSEIKIHSFKHSKQIFLGVLKGEIRDAKRDVVLLNAAAGLYVGGKVQTLTDGILLAKNAIDSGSAYLLFKKLVST